MRLETKHNIDDEVYFRDGGQIKHGTIKSIRVMYVIKPEDYPYDCYAENKDIIEEDEAKEELVKRHKEELESSIREFKNKLIDMGYDATISIDIKKEELR